MDYMYNACSTTARRGALDWAPIFEKANLPVFEALYKSVKDGTETRKSLEFNGRDTYREDLAKELKEINEQEIWVAGMLTCVIVFTSSHLPCRQDCPFAETRLQARKLRCKNDGDLKKFAVTKIRRSLRASYVYVLPVYNWIYVLVVLKNLL